MNIRPTEQFKRDLVNYTHEEHLRMLPPRERQDLALLEELLPQHYRPSDKPWTMIVGASAIREATVLREFHSSQFRIDPQDVKVAGCTISRVPSGNSFMGDLDIILSGPFEGDALDSATWMMPFMMEKAERYEYDIVFIRHPDLVNISDWADIYCRAVENLTSEGALVTLIRSGDGEKFDMMQQLLARKHGISPLRLDPEIVDHLFGGAEEHDRVAIFKKAS